MPLWEIALIALALAWAVQAGGIWFQTRHYQSVFSDLRTRWSDGELGAGASSSRFGKGVIALLVLGPLGDVRAARVMIGRTVFAKFTALPELEGLSMKAFEARLNAPDFDKSRRIAFGKAIEQIERVRTNRAEKSAPAARRVEETGRDETATTMKGGALC